jgi:uncharacterized protein (TIGR02145 family)
MANYKYVCTNNPEHLFDEPTADHWCNICDISTHPMLKPIEQPTPQKEVLATPLPHELEQATVLESEAPKDAETNALDNSVSETPPNPHPIQTNEIKVKKESEPKHNSEPELKNIVEVIPEIIVGKQTWMKYFLHSKTLSNDGRIFHAKTPKEWAEAKDSRRAAWCYPNNDASLGEKIGLLYNYYAVTHPEGLAPEGWDVPTLDDIMLLKEHGAKGFIKEHLKYSIHKDVSHRLALGSFIDGGSKRILWTQSHHVVYTAYAFLIHGENHEIDLRLYDKSAGFFVRCIKRSQ